MKVKVGSVIIGFIMICIGIAALAGQTPVFGIHPVVWFILGAMLICSDSAWEKLARAKRGAQRGEGASAEAPGGDGARGVAASTATAADGDAAGEGAGAEEATTQNAAADGPANGTPSRNATPASDELEGPSGNTAKHEESR